MQKLISILFITILVLTIGCSKDTQIYSKDINTTNEQNNSETLNNNNINNKKNKSDNNDEANNNKNLTPIEIIDNIKSKISNNELSFSFQSIQESYELLYKKDQDGNYMIEIINNKFDSTNNFIFYNINNEEKYFYEGSTYTKEEFVQTFDNLDIDEFTSEMYNYISIVEQSIEELFITAKQSFLYSTKSKKYTNEDTFVATGVSKTNVNYKTVIYRDGSKIVEKLEDDLINTLIISNENLKIKYK